MVTSPSGLADPGRGLTYLIPAGLDDAIEQQLRQGELIGKHKATWVLRVRRLSASRQRIEVYRFGDGFWGGAYEATANEVIPLYRKAAGPGFAFVFGPIAFVLNLVLWGALWLAGRWYVRRSGRRGAA